MLKFKMWKAARLEKVKFSISNSFKVFVPNIIPYPYNIQDAVQKYADRDEHYAQFSTSANRPNRESA